MGSNGASQPILCADVGGTKIQAAVVDDRGRVLSRYLTLTQAEEGPSRVIERIVACLSEALQRSGTDSTALLGIGIGAPGPLDPVSGTLFSPPNLPGWDNIGLAEVLQDRMGLRCFVDNDVNVGTLGEHRYGAARGARHALGIFVGTGIGGGIIIDQELHYGFNRTGGEVGHMIVAAGRSSCGCGAKGCLEALASRTAMVKRIKRLARRGEPGVLLRGTLKDQPDLPSSAIARLYGEADPIVTRVVDDAGMYLGLAIAGLINLLSPEVIVLGGGVMEAMWDILFQRVHDNAMKNALPMARGNVRIVKASLGDDAGVVGASVMARRRLEPIRRPL